ncbi:uncharacterized protein [Euwallacea fornicatus]|uniref:uncharacterized protein isoform X2 n=1 Tax=Euwallacea fornicatus TaxID=995702 RepID=UPI003390327B
MMIRNTSSLIAIILVFCSPAVNGQSTNESEPTVGDSDIQEEAHLPNGHKHYLTYQDFNKQAKNESYSRTENDLKTNKEIESISGSRSGAGIDIVGAKSQESAALVQDAELQNRDSNSSGASLDVNPREGGVGEKIGHFDRLDAQRREISVAVDYGKRNLEDLIKIKEPFLYNLGLFLDGKDPAAKVANFGAPHNQRALLLSRFGYATLEASRKLTESFQKYAGRQPASTRFDLTSRIDLDECPLKGKPHCPAASLRFRTADGTCNNLEHPWRGSALLPMPRFLPPLYEDGVQSVRLSVFGNALPSPRQISTDIHRDHNREIHSVTLMFTQWGQFIDHDVTSTVKSRAFNGSIPRCCSEGGGRVLPAQFLHPSCLPIEVPIDDKFLSRFGIGCMEFTRSAPSTRINCDLGWREQINQVTSFIDGSMIYGSDRESSDIVRTFKNGMIFYGKPAAFANQSPSADQDFPSEDFCRSGPLTEECIQPGDLRASENPGLIAIHTIFVRYHNKVASVLSQLNPHWSDRRVFEETRRIVYSVIQHITYREYLPVVVGPQVVDLFDLKLTNTGYFNNYDSRVNPAIANSFSSAAFRFGHSMVQNSFIRTDSHHRPIHNNVTLHNELDNEENIWSIGSLDRLLLGLINQPSQKRDEFMAEELTNHLFQPGDSTRFGMDLAAINIQRGRDHGIPPYTFWREPCGLPPIKSWSDLRRVINTETVVKLKSLYAHVDDIDLFTAGLAEKPLRGAVVGPTFSCIIAQQFSNLRKGDRFWYENGDFPSAFSLEQLGEIRRVSLAQVICQTMNEVRTIQQFVFLSADNFRNARVSCDSHDIEGFDLAAWREEDFETNNIAGDKDDFESERPHKSKSRRRRDNKGRNELTVTTPTPQKKIKIPPKNHPVSGQLKHETFTHKSIHRPTTYYKIKDQSNDDVTYLLGLVPQGPTKSPPLQIHININYGPQVNTPAIPQKGPSSITSLPTFDENNAILITKRPVTRLTSTTENSISYPTFIYSSSSRRPTNATSFASSNMQYATTHGLKRPNSNKFSHRLTTTTPGYFAGGDSAGQSSSDVSDYIYDPVDSFHIRPAYTSATNHHRPQHTSGPTVFEDRPFSTSTYNTYDRTKRPTHDQDWYSHDSNYDHRNRPQTLVYDRDETDFSDDISQEFFDRVDADEAGKGRFGETTTRRVGIDDKLDLSSRIFLERAQSDFDGFVQMSPVKKLETYGLDTDRTRHERAAHQGQGPNLLSASNSLPLDGEVAELPSNLPCSNEVRKTVERLPAIDGDGTITRTR